MLPDDKRQQLDTIVQKMVANKESDDNIHFVVDDFKKKYTAPASSPAPVPQAPSYGSQITSALTAGGPLAMIGSAVKSGFQNLLRAPSDIKGAVQGGVQQIQQGASDIQNSSGGVMGAAQGLGGGLKMESGLASIIASPLAPFFKPIGEGVNFIGDKVGDIPAVQQFAQTGVGKAVTNVAEGVANLGNVAGTIAGVNQVTKGVQGVAPKVQAKVESAFTDTPASLDKTIVDKYTQAVKPTIIGKTTPGTLERYNNNVVSAVKTIAQNKLNIEFTDEFGTKTQGQLPKTPSQFVDAIEQTKSTIFNQYDALASKAGKQGALVSSEPIHTQLNDVASNEALQTTNPAAVSYAKAWQERLTNADGTPKSFNVKITQDVIKFLNEKLDAFYKNPSYDNASSAAIDASVAKLFRDQLDKQIESATGDPGYQALKNQYAALKAIERDAAKRAVVLARQQGAAGAAGLGKYVDIFSGGDMLHGLLTLNPALFAKGAGQTALTRFFQYMNSPDRAIQNMFSAAEKTPAAPKTVAPSPTAAIPASSAKGSTLSKLKEAYKNSPLGDQRGMIRNPFGADISGLPSKDSAILKKFIDAVRLKGKSAAPDMTDAEWAHAEQLLTKKGHSLNQPLTKLANLAEDMLGGGNK